MHFGRIFASFLLAVCLFLFLSFPNSEVTYAQTERAGTVLPATHLSTADCRILMDFVSGSPGVAQKVFSERQEFGMILVSERWEAVDEQMRETGEGWASALEEYDRKEAEYIRIENRLFELRDKDNAAFEEYMEKVAISSDAPVDVDDLFLLTPEEAREMEEELEKQAALDKAIDELLEYRATLKKEIEELEAQLEVLDDDLDSLENILQGYEGDFEKLDKLEDLKTEGDLDELIDQLKDREDFPAPLTLPSSIADKKITSSDILACGIRTGAMKLWMIPYYIRFMLEFIISLAGLIAVAGTVYGGYLYMFGGISDDKDKGKKAMLYGVVGMIMTLVAWAVVSIFIALLTRL